ncbi:MAG TPA: adenylyl-sulfate kinase [Candidatus Nitrosotalea sp.]|nr:adenylyl-sulfate kinase [Candidatus Nitrosotalea sp.]
MTSPVVWLTGIPASGKTTISLLLRDYCKSKNLAVDILDGDELRNTLSKDLGFTPEERKEHNRRVIIVAKLLSRNDIITIVPLISPYRETREIARKEIPNFVEVYIKASVEECMRRDPKGLYKKAKAGDIQNLTGLQSPFEEPENSELVLDTQKYSKEECLDMIIHKLQDLGYL